MHRQAHSWALSNTCPQHPLPSMLLPSLHHPCRLSDARGQPVGPNRVWLADAWVPGLAMSRAIGDIVAHTVGVSSGAAGCWGPGSIVSVAPAPCGGVCCIILNS